MNALVHPPTAGLDQARLVRGTVDSLLLALLDREEDYGYGLARRLRSRGLHGIGDATVYAALRRMHRSGLLEAEDRRGTSGPPQRWFLLTTAGRERLVADRIAWRSFATAVAATLDPPAPSDY